MKTPTRFTTWRRKLQGMWLPITLGVWWTTSLEFPGWVALLLGGTVLIESLKDSRVGRVLTIRAANRLKEPLTVKRLMDPESSKTLRWAIEDSHGHRIMAGRGTVPGYLPLCKEVAFVDVDEGYFRQPPMITFEYLDEQIDGSLEGQEQGSESEDAPPSTSRLAKLKDRGRRSSHHSTSCEEGETDN